MVFEVLYAAATIGLAIYGFNALILSALYLFWRWRDRTTADVVGKSRNTVTPFEWPTVTVQLPIYNERFVVERLIDAVARLDYPSDRLTIQVLDDSTDDTVALARARVASHRARGLRIEHLQRPDRDGYKAGALAYGLARTSSEFAAIFDADFLPPPDFLKRTLPHFADPRIGMTQACWGHLNAHHSLLTRAQSLMLDGHFGVEQAARDRCGFFFNFNGSAGVWRVACIHDAGGWGMDTVAEDLDLSYRAQLRGWKLVYLPNVIAPAEIPTLVSAFKRQQFRWAKGSIQCLLKFGRPLWASPQPLWHKAQSFLHLGGYLLHPLMLLLVLAGLPVVLHSDVSRFQVGAASLGWLGAPILFTLAQWALYPDWRSRLKYLPTLILVGPGLAVNNTWAVIEALTGRNPTMFLRTPKLGSSPVAAGLSYHLPADRSTWIELFFMLYSGLTTLAALRLAPGLAPFTALYTLGFGYTACLGLRQSLKFKAATAKLFEGMAATE
jgi:cellulose synthase/poly-beta-1,6-N-acetylglucosamine synthase-like glycosyltransferase